MEEKAQRLNLTGSWHIEVPLQVPGFNLSEKDQNLALRVSKILGSSLEVVGPETTKVGIFVRTDIPSPPSKPLVGVQIFLEEGSRLRWVDRAMEETVEGHFRIDYGKVTVLIKVAQVTNDD